MTVAAGMEKILRIPGGGICLLIILLPVTLVGSWQIPAGYHTPIMNAPFLVKHGRLCIPLRKLDPLCYKLCLPKHTQVSCCVR